jgi:N-acetylglucosaminyldiphosphoundecaprenol N-acetyl-beta-D-mannosaminyltransferase
MQSDVVSIGGIELSRKNLQETIGYFLSVIEHGQKIRVCVLPSNCIVWAKKNAYLREIYNTSDLNLADGVPIVWASRILGHKIRSRVTGLDLFPQMLNISTAYNVSHYFLGAKEGVAEILAKKIQQQYPLINIAGYYSPPFADRFSDKENEKIITLINNVKPNILWVSLTAPKQDVWLYENYAKLDVNIVIGVGGAFEVTAGLISRAPLFMQKIGMEWFYRFYKEPIRLFRRYYIEAPQFFPIVCAQLFSLMQNKLFKSKK